MDCAKIGENRGCKDISYSPFYGTGCRDPGNYVNCAYSSCCIFTFASVESPISCELPAI